MAEFQSTTDFQIKDVIISPADGSKGYAIKNLVADFTYVENIKYPFIMAMMEIVDSAGLITKLPIQGGEIVQVKLKTSIEPDGFEYNFRVWKIANRYVKNKDQAYTLGLISEESLNNEFLRLVKSLEGTPDTIINNLLKNELKTQKEYYSEKCVYAVKLIAARRRIFDIISSLLPKSVPGDSEIKPITATKKSNNSTQGQEQRVSGSAGFFFWENRRGYNFFSVDTLCSDKPNGSYDGKPWGPYLEKVANQSDGADDRFTIASAMFTSEIDLVTSMRMGRYATLMCFFNHSTGQYDEYVYNVKDAFDDMKHLGTQGEPSLIKLGNNKTLAEYPTRMMSMLLDHESWFNEATPASPYTKDGSTSPSQYSERHLEHAAQSITRYETLSNQTATIVIPGNSKICAGDKIDIKLINKLPDADLKSEPYDPENSGIYLIIEVSHSYERTSGSNGKFTTTLRIARDTHGDINKVSNHGTK